MTDGWTALASRLGPADEAKLALVGRYMAVADMRPACPRLRQLRAAD